MFNWSYHTMQFNNYAVLAADIRNIKAETKLEKVGQERKRPPRYKH